MLFFQTFGVLLLANVVLCSAPTPNNISLVKKLEMEYGSLFECESTPPNFKEDFEASVKGYSLDVESPERQEIIEHLKARYDHHVIDALFNDSEHHISSVRIFGSGLERNLALFEAALHLGRFGEPMLIDHRFLMSSMDELVASRYTFRLSEFEMGKYLDQCQDIELDSLQKLLSRCPGLTGISDSFMNLLKVGGVTEAILIDPDYLTVKLALRLAIFEDSNTIEALLDGIDPEELSESYFIGACRFNIDQELVLCNGLVSRDHGTKTFEGLGTRSNPL